MSPRGSQRDCGLLSKEYNQESKKIENLAPEGTIIINQALEGEISTMVVIKWSDEIKGPRVKVDCWETTGKHDQYVLKTIFVQVESYGPRSH